MMDLIFGLGILWLLINFVAGIVDLIEAARIRPSVPTAYAVLVREETNFQNIIAPAVAALISGLLISISASYLFESAQQGTEDGRTSRFIGLGMFILAVVALAVTLRIALGKGPKAVDFIKHPTAIRAAAEEYIKNPGSAPLPPDVLKVRLDAWTYSIAARSVGSRRDIQLARLQRSLENASASHGHFRRVMQSAHIHVESTLRFSSSFVWPYVGFTLFASGLFARVGLGDTPRAIFVHFLAISISGALAFFAISARGHRTKRRYQANVQEVDDCRRIITRAEVVRQEVVDAAKRRERMWDSVEAFLHRHDSTTQPTESWELALGGWSLRLGRRRS